MLYELTPREIARVRACARSVVDQIPEWEREVMLAEAREHGVPNPGAFFVGLEDPEDVRVGWAGRHILTVPRAALASDEPLVDFGELPPAPDDLSGLDGGA